MPVADAMRAPGVSIELLPNTGPRPIETLATAVLAMVGLYDPDRQKEDNTTNSDPKSVDIVPDAPIRVSSWSDFASRLVESSISIPGTCIKQCTAIFLTEEGKLILSVCKRKKARLVRFQGRSFSDAIKSLEACEDVTLLACPDVFQVTPTAPANATGSQAAGVAGPSSTQTGTTGSSDTK